MKETTLLTERILACTYGNYPWDEWKETAIKKGVTEQLATLGRETMREAYQHGWSDQLKSLCGWADNGKRMIALALRSPEKAKRRWQKLMDTDGLRGEWNLKTGQWRSW